MIILVLADNLRSGVLHLAGAERTICGRWKPPYFASGPEAMRTNFPLCRRCTRIRKAARRRLWLAHRRLAREIRRAEAVGIGAGDIQE